ncbi:MAG TPA: PAS domain S-box protein, partial [Opitutaceae bacterium]|nr:PAS domain S-box protein [Opitutaceae bacterium]
MKKRPLRRKKAAVRTAPPSARLLAAALRSLGEGVFIAGPKLLRDGLPILFANDRLCAMTGYARAELTGRGHAFLHADAVAIVRLRRWLGKLQSGLIFSGEGYLACKSGTTIFAAWNFSPIFNARDRMTYIVATYRDTTTKRRLQEALVHAQRLDAVGRLAGGVAHDFNNVLTVIQTYASFIEESLDHDAAARADVIEIRRAA